MRQSITGVEAAMMEAKGEGQFFIQGRSIIFRSSGIVWAWHHASPSEAATILKVLRAAPKYHKEVA